MRHFRCISAVDRGWVCAFLYCAIFCAAGGAQAETYISGTLDGGAAEYHWTEAGSPYIIESGATVPHHERFDDWGEDGIPGTGDYGEGDGEYTPGIPGNPGAPGEPYDDYNGNDQYDALLTLTIDANVIVQIRYSSLHVDGVLNATQVLFTRTEDAPLSDWRSLYFDETNPSETSSGLLDSCTFGWSQGGARATVYSETDSLEVTGGTMLQLTLNDCSPTVTGVEFPESDPIDAWDNSGFSGFTSNTFTHPGARITVYGSIDESITWPDMFGIQAYVVEGLSVYDGGILNIEPDVRVETEGYYSHSPKWLHIETGGTLFASDATFALTTAAEKDVVGFNDPSATGELTNCTFEAVEPGGRPVLLVMSDTVMINGGQIPKLRVDDCDPTVMGVTFPDEDSLYAVNDVSFVGFSDNIFEQPDTRIYVGGTIDEGARWGLVGELDTYVLASGGGYGVLVRDGATLEIVSGIRVERGAASLTVWRNGLLDATGVTFALPSGVSSDNYNMVSFDAYGGEEAAGQLVDCVFEASDVGGRPGLHTESSNVSVSGGTMLQLTLNDCSPTVTGVEFPESDPIDAWDNSGFSGFTSNTFTHPGARITVYGSIDESITWPDMFGIQAYVVEGLSVYDGGILNIEPDVRVETEGYYSHSPKWLHIETGGTLFASDATFALTTAAEKDVVGFNDPSATGELTNCTFEAVEPGGRPVLLVMSDTVMINGGQIPKLRVDDCDPTVMGVTFPDEDSLYAVNDVSFVGFSDNIFEQPDTRIYVGGTIDEGARWGLVGELDTYVLASGGGYGVLVRDGATLEIVSGIRVERGAASLTVWRNGLLDATGVTFALPSGVSSDNYNMVSFDAYGGEEAAGQLVDCVFEASDVGGRPGLHTESSNVSVSGGTMLQLTLNDCSPTVTGVEFPESDPIDAWDNSGFSGFTSNTFTHPGARITVYGSIDESITWPDMFGIQAYVVEGLSVYDGGILNIEPDVRVETEGKTYYQRYLHVDENGTLTADEVIFALTAPYESEVVGFTESSAIGILTNCAFGATEPEGIPVLRVEAGQANVHACLSAKIHVSGGELNMSSSVVVGGTGGLLVTGSGNATALLCGFVGQSEYGAQNDGSGVADARWCWWDDPSGPSGEGPGTGTPVLGNVLYDPWLTYAPVNWESQCQYGEDVPSIEVSLDRLWVWNAQSTRFVDPGGPITLRTDQPTYILSHGWDGDLAHPNRPSLASIGCSIYAALPEANILAWDWSAAANPDLDPDTFTELNILLSLLPQPPLMFWVNPVWQDAFLSGINAGLEGTVLGASLAALLHQHGSLGSAVHLIGHSHGGGVVGRAAQVMYQLGYPADSLTTLDTPKLPQLLINTAAYTQPSSVERAACFYYPFWECVGVGGDAPSGATNVQLSCAHVPPLPELAHLWIAGNDDFASCPSSEGWYPPGVWVPGSGPNAVYFSGETRSLLDPVAFPSGDFEEEDAELYDFVTRRRSKGGRDEPPRSDVESLSLRLEELFDTADAWTGSYALLVEDADPDDPLNRTVMMQEVGEASFFQDVAWRADAFTMTFDYMFMEPRGEETLTVYLDDQIVYFDSAESTLAVDHLTTSDSVYVGNHASSNARLNFVLRSDDNPGGALLVDNVRVYAVRTGDLDGDYDIDGSDFAQFSTCLTGPGISPTPDCVDADIDGDSDTDLRDFCYFQQGFTGDQP